MEHTANTLYRSLPQVGELLDSAESAALIDAYSRDLVANAARTVLARVREEIRLGRHDTTSLQGWRAEMWRAMEQELRTNLQPSLRRVINATGVILQTNLGRAPLSKAALAQVVEVASGYCNLEIDLDTGARSRRDVHVERLILDVLALRSGAAMGSLHVKLGAAVVNNCAAATFLALNTMAEGGEVIVSRGELVEIGGGFRVPDILRKSGATLREVGTTNRTRIADYEGAITPESQLILRVHRSNFRIEGFTEQPTLHELIELGAKHNIPVFEDQGTGCVVTLSDYGVQDETSWLASCTSGAALIAASGDKLLGGPQCGLLVGDRAAIERIRKNPLFRALRVDKLTYAALQSTLLAYLAGDQESLPTIHMMRLPAAEIQRRCDVMAAALHADRIEAEVVATGSVVGGGTTPGATLPSFAVAVRHAAMSEGEIATALRHAEPPVVTRTMGGLVVLDLRTVEPADDVVLIELLRSHLGGTESIARGNAVERAHEARR